MADGGYCGHFQALFAKENPAETGSSEMRLV